MSSVESPGTLTEASGRKQPAAEIRPSLSGGDWTDIATALAVATAMYGGLLWFALNYPSGYSTVVILSGLLGTALGWAVGLLLSPYNEAERSAFGELAKLVYGFISGYALSKLDPLITTALQGTVSPHAVA